MYSLQIPLAAPDITFLHFAYKHTGIPFAVLNTCYKVHFAQMDFDLAQHKIYMLACICVLRSLPITGSEALG